ncbi:unnamed protein product [Protopolystoma xenopodis]|uniref:Secreted protein n=1 Tax=Protopolystoma xenopodis TaxID=117903 RepID=A0A3S5BSC6_9PLAT|nr:unnamed protein product [Protopolystoma xenopodis]
MTNRFFVPTRLCIVVVLMTAIWANCRAGGSDLYAVETMHSVALCRLPKGRKMGRLVYKRPLRIVMFEPFMLSKKAHFTGPPANQPKPVVMTSSVEQTVPVARLTVLHSLCLCACLFAWGG